MWLILASCVTICTLLQSCQLFYVKSYRGTALFVSLETRHSEKGTFQEIVAPGPLWLQVINLYP